MKKTISIILSLIMLLSTIPLNTFAKTKTEVPEIKLGSTESVTVEKNSTEIPDNQLYLKFSPEESGLYEFVFDKNDNNVTDELLEGEELIHRTTGTEVQDYETYSNAPCYMYSNGLSFSVKLEKGINYYLKIVNSGDSDFIAKVTVNKHTHKYSKDSYRLYKAKVSNSTKIGEYGAHYYYCTEDCCSFFKKISIPAVRGIELSKTSYTYDGKQKKPSVKVYTSEKKELPKDCYTVSYGNNKSIGTAFVTLTFTGEYEGSVKREYNILPKSTSITKLSPKKKGFTVKYKKLKKNVSGYQIQYAKDSKFTKSAKKLTVKGN
ncbi:MAG: hypothetical protein IJT65_02200, partial [Eubacterium sp.]|nr:hypothetical protein [Eubacterium sp.]